MKLKALLAVFVCIAVLGGCNMSKDKTKDTGASTESLTAISGTSEITQPSSLADTTSEYKTQIPEESDGHTDPATEALIFNIIKNEAKAYLDAGMTILFTGETIKLDGADCYLVDLGTNHEEQFVREIHYAVNIKTQQVYLYDVIMDTWEELP